MLRGNYQIGKYVFRGCSKLVGYVELDGDEDNTTEGLSNLDEYTSTFTWRHIIMFFVHIGLLVLIAIPLLVLVLGVSVLSFFFKMCLRCFRGY